MYNAQSLAPARVLFYTVDKDEHGKRTIATRRQNARYAYMKAVAEKHGTMECEALTKMANHWWPGTNPTIYETGRV